MTPDDDDDADDDVLNIYQFRSGVYPAKINSKILTNLQQFMTNKLELICS